MISDAVTTRHTFSADTILNPYQYLVVFGGGNPQPSDIFWQVASTGSLGLNNTGDTISLQDSTGQLVAEAVYGSLGGRDQSLALWPEGIGTEYLLHSTIDEAEGSIFSPGRAITQAPSGHSVPELPVWFYFGAGNGVLLFLPKRAAAIG